MTVSERNVDAIFWVMDVDLRRSELRGVGNGFIAALGLGAHAFVAGGGTFVASALLGLPFCAGLLCLHLPVTFKAQGFQSRGGGTLVASALLGLNSCCCFCFTRPPSLEIAVCLGGLRGLLVDWDNPSFGLGCSFTLLHGASVRCKAH